MYRLAEVTVVGVLLPMDLAGVMAGVQVGVVTGVTLVAITALMLATMLLQWFMRLHLWLLMHHHNL
jgi:hypothetical protein